MKSPLIRGFWKPSLGIILGFLHPLFNLLPNSGKIRWIRVYYSSDRDSVYARKGCNWDGTILFISNLFLVPKKSDGFRPVINLKPLNHFLQEIHFKMESIQTAIESLNYGDYMVSLDLKASYFSVPIFSPHKKYLRFVWKGVIFQFTCFPFGYSLAPRVFTTIFKPILASLRFKEVRLIIFIDDILIIAKSFTLCNQHLTSVRELLESLGFVINVAKSSLIPITRITFLGFDLDSITMKVFLS